MMRPQRGTVNMYLPEDLNPEYRRTGQVTVESRIGRLLDALFQCFVCGNECGAACAIREERATRGAIFREDLAMWCALPILEIHGFSLGFRIFSD